MTFHSKRVNINVKTNTNPLICIVCECMLLMSQLNVTKKNVKGLNKIIQRELCAFRHPLRLV